ncbi:MAG: DUF615 domain-containing protein [Candidatus Aminicenantes bacterium]|nr:DUF615 domain-containing protein [Candidatus Aminicenantes bacterium]
MKNRTDISDRILTTEEDPAEIPLSRTRQKKEDHARQMMGERLVELPATQLERICLPVQIREEVLLATKTTAHGARRRQIKYIGSLLRDIDTTSIENALEAIARGDYEQKEAFKRIENWRDRLKEGDMGLIDDILTECPMAERQKLMQLARNARKEFEANKGIKGSRALFRYLKEVMKG